MIEMNEIKSVLTHFALCVENFDILDMFLLEILHLMYLHEGILHASCLCVQISMH